MNATHKPSFETRCAGSLLGLAAGDALGTTLEFSPPNTFAPISDMVGGGPFGLRPGEWTDDTSMALCLAKSLIECSGFDPADQMRRYVRWWKEGYYSSTGKCFDIGSTVCTALQRFLATGEPYSGSEDKWSAGNGSLMRLAPIPLYFASDPLTAIELAGASSRTTHGNINTIDACRYFAGLIIGALAGATKAELLTPFYAPIPDLWSQNPLTEEIAEIAGGSFCKKALHEIRGTGHVVRSLEAALWAFSLSTDFKDGALLAVNLGDDADTTGAIYGQLAGAYYGLSSIPETWQARIAAKDTILEIAAAISDHGR